MSVINSALDYLKRGFSITAVKRDETKKAFEPWKRYQTELPSEHEARALFKKYPGANVAILTGEFSGLVVLDIDGAEGEQAVEGRHLPITPQVRTRRGRHLFFRYPQGRLIKTNSALLPQVDIRATGGYVVAPPSVHHTGHVYEWFDGLGLDEVPLADLPEWILQLAEENPSNSKLVEPDEWLRDVLGGERDATFTRLAGSLLAKGMPPEAVLDFLLYQNDKRCVPPMEPSQVEKIVRSIGRMEAAQAAARAAVEFSGIKPFKKKNLPPFPVDALPNILAIFVRAKAAALQVPLDLPGVLLLSILGTCSGGKVRVQGAPDWVEPTNLFSLVILPPGERKSATISALRKPLDFWEALQREKLAPEIAKKEAERRALVKALSNCENHLAKNPKDQSALADLQAAAERLASFKIKRAPRLTTSDATPEKVVSLMHENKGRMAILSAEGGLLEIAAGRYSNGMGNFEFLLSGHAGDTMQIDRVGRASETVQRPALTVGICAQPDVLKTIQKNQQFRGRGLSARFLYSIPLPMVGSRDIEPEPMPENIQNDYERLVYRLLNICEDTRLKLTPEAAQTSKRFALWLEPKLKPETGEYSAFADWCAKAHGAALRIAGLLHMAEFTTDYEIPAETLERAFKIIRYFIEHAQRALDADEQGEHAAAMKAIRLIQMEKIETVTPSFLMRKNRLEWPTAEEALETLETLEEHGYATAIEIKRRGRPAPTFAVNPEILR